jgi:hypothetical protein
MGNSLFYDTQNQDSSTETQNQKLFVEPLELGHFFETKTQKMYTDTQPQPQPQPRQLSIETITHTLSTETKIQAINASKRAVKMLSLLMIFFTRSIAIQLHSAAKYGLFNVIHYHHLNGNIVLDKNTLYTKVYSYAVKHNHVKIVQFLHEHYPLQGKGVQHMLVCLLTTACKYGCHEVSCFISSLCTSAHILEAIVVCARYGRLDIIQQIASQNVVENNKTFVCTKSGLFGHNDVTKHMNSFRYNKLKPIHRENKNLKYLRGTFNELILSNNIAEIMLIILQCTSKVPRDILDKNAVQFHSFSLAIKCGHVDIVDTFIRLCKYKLNAGNVLTAARCGRTDMVKFMYDQIKVKNGIDALKKSIRYGHLSTCQFLWKKEYHKITKSLSWFLLCMAIQYKYHSIASFIMYQNVVKRFTSLPIFDKRNLTLCNNEQRSRNFTVDDKDVYEYFNTFQHAFPHYTEEMDLVARDGNLDALMTLHHNGAQCTAQAMFFAAKHGHHHVVLFLHEHRTEGCIETALKIATMNGHHDCVEIITLHRDQNNGEIANTEPIEPN